MNKKDSTIKRIEGDDPNLESPEPHHKPTSWTKSELRKSWSSSDNIPTIVKFKKNKKNK